MPAQLPIQIDRRTRTTLQDQLFNEIRQLILSSRLRPCSALPATRELCGQLGVSRNTVLLAYERLIAEGYLETRPAIGTFVTTHLPEDSLLLQAGRVALKDGTAVRKRCPLVFRGRPHGVYNGGREQLPIDFKVGRPAPDSFPVKRWSQMTAEQLRLASENLTEYTDPAGLHRLRKAIADHLGPARGITVSAEQVLVVAGCQEALNIIARLFVHERTRVAIECPAYQGAAYLFESYGAELLPVPVDTEGLQTSRLPGGEVSLAYLTPSHQYPLGHTLSLKRRLELIDWAGRSGAYLVEDDYDSDFRHHGSPLTALKGLDHCGCVIYLGTFSKSIGAALRLGYMVLPEELVEPARTVKTLLNNGQPWLDQAVLAAFIASGGFANHLRRIRRTYLHRRDCLVEQLHKHFGEVHLSGLEGGMHLTWRIPDDFPDAPRLERMAREEGVGIYSLPTGAAYCKDTDELVKRTIMLGYSSLGEVSIKEGIARIARIAATALAEEAAATDSSLCSLNQPAAEYRPPT